MKLENFLMSKEKWTAIVAELEKPGRVDWDELRGLIYISCGHCREYAHVCAKCNLEKESLCSSRYLESLPYYVIRNMVWSTQPRNKRKALQIAKRIYKAILKDEPMGQ